MTGYPPLNFSNINFRLKSDDVICKVNAAKFANVFETFKKLHSLKCNEILLQNKSKAKSLQRQVQ